MYDLEQIQPPKVHVHLLLKTLWKKYEKCDNLQCFQSNK